MKDGKMSMMHHIAALLVIIGGLNWGLIAINMDWNLVEMLFGNWPTLERIVYGLVGLAALKMIFIMHKMKKGDASMMKKAEKPAMETDQM